MDELIAEGWIREVKIVETVRNVTRTTRVFFPKDQNNSEVEFKKDELPGNCQEYLSGLWQSMGSNAEFKWEELLLKQPQLLCEEERQMLTTRKIKNQARLNAQFDDKGRLITDSE